MSQAPPTPPPMSAIELRDEARDFDVPSHATTPDSPDSVVVPQQTPAAQDIYQQVFPQLSDLAEERNFIGIINIAELHDLNVSIPRPVHERISNHVL
jgi:COP9 signalosome complex subunit 8